MSVEIEMKPDKTPFTVHSMRPLVPYKVHSHKSMIAGSNNSSRFESVKESLFVGDIVVIMPDAGMYSNRIFNCRTGTIEPSWFADYLLFEEANEVKRVSIAKPEN